VGECFFWYRLTRVSGQNTENRVCVCVCVCENEFIGGQHSTSYHPTPILPSNSHFRPGGHENWCKYL